MAGIGFRLRKLFEHDTFIDNMRAVVFSASISSGPVFFSILCLGLLGVFSRAFVSVAELQVFAVTIVYVFAFSLISTGATQLVLTRYLSDLIYLEKNATIAPTFAVAITLTMLMQFILGLPFILYLEAPLTYRILAVMLFIIVGCIWQMMVFLSAVKDYQSIVYAFASGMTISFFLAMHLGEKSGLSGLMHGYVIGQLVLFFILLARVLIEFRSDEKPTLKMFSYFGSFSELIYIGLFYNMAIWIDKIIFWFSSEGEQINGFLYAFTLYDTATFVAFLTVIPSYTFFLVKIETDFFEYFQAFYRTIIDKQPLANIYRQRSEIARSMRESFSGLIKLQGLICMGVVIYSDELIAFLGMPATSAPILEKTVIAVFLQMLLLTTMIFLMYFDVRRQLKWITILYFAANVVFTLITIRLGYPFYGYGYLAANLVALVASYFVINRHIYELEFQTFVSQPIQIEEKEDEKAEPVAAV